MSTGSAIDRRRDRAAVVIAGHPSWRGIHHPELITLPPRRFSQLDMLPAIERGRPSFGSLDAHARRTERNRQIIAAHPRWRGIRHPDRIVFVEAPRDADPLRAYHLAVRRALRHLRESQVLCERVSAVADSIDGQRWPWCMSPAELAPKTPKPPTHPDRRRRPRLPSMRLPWRPSFPGAHPAGRLSAG
jgi:hypothetical protein